jgi:DNA mismatch repair protein MutS2
LEYAGEDDFLQAFERFPIPEEAGHADEQIPLERHQLIGILLQQLAVLHKAVDIAQADASQTAAAALTRRERELAVRSREAIDAAVREARDAIAEIVREAKRTRTAQAVEAARVALERKAKETTASLPEAPPLDVDKLRQALASRALGVSATSKKASKPSAKANERPDERASMQNRANTLDLRGQRADEALGELEAFLDRTALEGADVVFVIHGHGTGALRKVVREYLATSPYVERFRPGGKGEGGDGVSVVSLRG